MAIQRPTPSDPSVEPSQARPSGASGDGSPVSGDGASDLSKTPAAELTPLERLEVDPALADHPKAQALLTVWAAFEVGDNARVRALAAPLIAGSDVPPSIQEAARSLDEAVDFSKVHLIIAGSCLLFFLVILALIY